jgi:hypothetical protein
MKVFSVFDPRLPDGQTSQTQDWFFNNASSIELIDIDTALEIMSLREKHLDEPNTLGLELRLRTDAMKQMAH